jgi:hypothetical protein
MKLGLVCVLLAAAPACAACPTLPACRSRRAQLAEHAPRAGAATGCARGTDHVRQPNRDVHCAADKRQARNGYFASSTARHLVAREFGTLLTRNDGREGERRFQWKHTAPVSGHFTWVFAFRVPHPHGYGLVEPTCTIVVRYEGLFYADPESGAVYRIELKCDIPEESEYKQLD